MRCCCVPFGLDLGMILWGLDIQDTVLQDAAVVVAWSAQRSTAGGDNTAQRACMIQCVIQYAHEDHVLALERSASFVVSRPHVTVLSLVVPSCVAAREPLVRNVLPKPDTALKAKLEYHSSYLFLYRASQSHVFISVGEFDSRCSSLQGTRPFASPKVLALLLAIERA